ncbi:MAG: hypothetical protein L6V93_10605 [Clostridiales bacterium]|nr:MAG: hypothetical protein L6V93_10605 [Clostridiales bacterium]
MRTTGAKRLLRPLLLCTVTKKQDKHYKIRHHSVHRNRQGAFAKSGKTSYQRGVQRLLHRALKAV